MSGRVVHVNDQVEGAVYIGRAVPRKGLKASPLANPFRIGRDGTRSDVISAYRLHLKDALIRGVVTEALIAARDKPLACWCRHQTAVRIDANVCHGDVVLEILDAFSDGEMRAMVVRP